MCIIIMFDYSQNYPRYYVHQSRCVFINFFLCETIDVRSSLDLFLKLKNNDHQQSAEHLCELICNTI